MVEFITKSSTAAVKAGCPGEASRQCEANARSDRAEAVQPIPCRMSSLDVPADHLHSAAEKVLHGVSVLPSCDGFRFRRERQALLRKGTE